MQNPHYNDNYLPSNIKPPLYILDQYQTYDLLEITKTNLDFYGGILNYFGTDKDDNIIYNIFLNRKILIERFTSWDYVWCESYSQKLYEKFKIFAGTELTNLKVTDYPGIENYIPDVFGNNPPNKFNGINYEELTLTIPSTENQEIIVITWLGIAYDYSSAIAYNKYYKIIKTENVEKIVKIKLNNIQPCSMIISQGTNLIDYNEIPGLFLWENFDNIFDELINHLIDYRPYYNKFVYKIQIDVLDYSISYNSNNRRQAVDTRYTYPVINGLNNSIASITTAPYFDETHITDIPDHFKKSALTFANNNYKNNNVNIELNDLGDDYYYYYYPTLYPQVKPEIIDNWNRYYNIVWAWGSNTYFKLHRIAFKYENSMKYIKDNIRTLIPIQGETATPINDVSFNSSYFYNSWDMFATVNNYNQNLTWIGESGYFIDRTYENSGWLAFILPTCDDIDSIFKPFNYYISNPQSKTIRDYYFDKFSQNEIQQSYGLGLIKRNIQYLFVSRDVTFNNGNYNGNESYRFLNLAYKISDDCSECELLWDDPNNRIVTAFNTFNSLGDPYTFSFNFSMVFKYDLNPRTIVVEQQRSKNEMIDFIDSTIYYNSYYISTGENSYMADSVRLKEIHEYLQLLFNPEKHCYDKDGNNAAFTLGDQIDLIAQVLGISFYRDGAIKSIRQRKNLKSGTAIPGGYGSGQFEIHTVGENSNYQDGGISGEERIGIQYDNISNNLKAGTFDPSSYEIEQGDYVLCENILQYFQAFKDDLDKALALQEMSAGLLPSEDGTKICSFEGMGILVAEVAWMLSKMSRDTSQTLISSLISQAVGYELLKATGLPLMAKSFKVKTSEVTNSSIVFPAVTGTAPNNLQQFMLLLENIAPILAYVTDIVESDLSNIIEE